MRMVDGGLGELLVEDGINPTRALILQAYYGLRRSHAASEIGTREIVAWIEAREPDTEVPSLSLIHLTLEQAGVAHRGPGRPSNKVQGPPPFYPAVRSNPPRDRSPK